MLMNIGFIESQKEFNYQCYIFHDVDLIPEDDRIMYGCTKDPTHMSAGDSNHQYKYMESSKSICKFV